MALSSSKAIEKAKNITNGKKYVGLCLVFVRDCFDIPAKYPSAASAWANAKKRHEGGNPNNYPAGVPVFFYTPATKYGHVALHLGGGKYRTNYSGKGTIVTANLSDPVFRGMKVLGWTEDLNGVKLNVDTDDKPSSKTVTVKKGDTLSEIALANKTTVAKLVSLNKLDNANLIFPGQKIKVS